MSLNPRWIACALILAWAMAFAGATAQGALELPGALEVVEESAFAGTDAIDSVVLREGVRLIRSRAFADSGLTEITLPSTIEAGGIAEDAFQNASLQTIHAVEASPAFEWALETPYTLRSGNAEFTYAIDDRACTLETWLGGGSAVTVPDDICGCPVTALGDSLFAARPALGRVTLPASVVSIAANAFDGRAEDLLICADKDSAPVAFARAHKIDYQAGTTYRALVIAQTYAGSSYYDYLPGTLNDAACMADCLSRFDGTPFEVAERVDVTADEMLAAIGETFGDAEQQDVSLFYYAGHGHDSPWNAELQGSLIGVDSGKVTPAALREAMDAIPGRKILIIDSCFSGAHIPADAQLALNAAPGGASAPTADPEAFVSAFLSGFSDSSSDGRRKGSRSSAADCYFIMAAASANQSSYESQLIEGSASADHGLFTYCLLEGCGYNCLSHSLVDAGADVNANGVITFLEGFSFASDMQESIIEDWNNDPLDSTDYRQNAQLYPADCGWFGLLRR